MEHLSGPTAKLETITPGDAQLFLLKNTGNRPLNDAHVQYLIQQMRSGQYKMTGESIKFAKTGRLIDGQHTLTAVLKSGVTIKKFVTRGLEEESFEYMDIGRNRTASDVLGVHGISNPAAMAAIAKFIINFERNLSH